MAKQQPLPRSDYGAPDDPLSALFRAFIDMFDPRPPMQESAARTYTRPKENIFDELATGSLGEGWPRESQVEPDFDQQIAADQTRRQRSSWSPQAQTPPLPEMNPAFHPSQEERDFIPSPMQAGSLMRSLLGLPEPNPLFRPQEAEEGVMPSMGNLQSFARMLAEQEAEPLPQPQLPPGYRQESVRARRVK